MASLLGTGQAAHLSDAQINDYGEWHDRALRYTETVYRFRGESPDTAEWSAYRFMAEHPQSMLFWWSDGRLATDAVDYLLREASL